MSALWDLVSTINGIFGPSEVCAAERSGHCSVVCFLALLLLILSLFSQKAVSLVLKFHMGS